MEVPKDNKPIPIILIFSSNSSNGYKKKKIKKLERITDRNDDLSLNKIVLQQCCTKLFVVQTKFNNN